MVLLLMLVGCMKAVTTPPESARVVQSVVGVPSRIAFGSCSKQSKEQPILDSIVAKQPDLMLYLGDNIYADTQRPMKMRRRYSRLAAKPEFIRLRTAMPTLSTWDDHDYGLNNAGSELSTKEESKYEFLKFWGVAADSPRWSRPGIYGQHTFEDKGRRLQIILLDTRWFRGPLKENPEIKQRAYDFPFKREYQPDDDPSITMLGEAQWAWLEAQLRQPADLRIVVTSIQFGHSYNGFESWNNLPVERERMERLIQQTEASGVVFLSGDVHWGEISRLDSSHVDYPLYDVTSSGLTQIWQTTEYNDNRLGSVVTEEHFGLLDIDWSQPDPVITMALINMAGETLSSTRTTIGEISNGVAAKD